MFRKYGNIFTIVGSNRVKTTDQWSNFVGSDTNKRSTAEGIIIHKSQSPINGQPVVCDIDLDNYIYIHTTIMASVDIEPNSDHYITRSTEKYINTNADAWPRDQLLKDYHTFVESGVVYVEHDQNPERAKGKILDAVARDMGDTILIDLLFCVDKRHKDLVHNIETGIANAVSMGCTTKYTICSICGNIAHDENEYCTHVKRMQNQMVRCDDGVYRKACELCYGNNFYDCSIVANPAFAGAVFRRLVVADQISSQLLSNLLCRKVSSMDYQNEVMKIASINKEAVHPIERSEVKDYEIEDEYADIPYRDPHNVKQIFDDQQPDGHKVLNAGKKKTARDEGCGSLVILTEKYNVPSGDRRIGSVFNFVGKNTVGRLVGKNADGCAVFFSKIGMITGIPLDIIKPFSIDKFSQDPGIEFTKKAKKLTYEDLPVQRRGTFDPTNERFVILSNNEDDDYIEVRWLDGDKVGKKENLLKKTLTDKNIRWASSHNLASFHSIWNGQHYQLKHAKWNEKVADVLDEVENHVDNVQHDIACVTPKTSGRKYSKPFTIKTKIGRNQIQFDSKVNNDDLQVEVNAICW